MNHTPGPWRHAPALGRFVITCPGGSEVGSAEGGNMEQDRANAQLIAAAPDLLAGLKDLFAMMDEGILVRNTDNDADPDFVLHAMGLTIRLKKIYDAIARAEGRQ